MSQISNVQLYNQISQILHNKQTSLSQLWTALRTHNLVRFTSRQKIRSFMDRFVWDFSKLWPHPAAVSPPDHDRKLHGPQVTPCQFFFQNCIKLPWIFWFWWFLRHLHHSVDVVRNLAEALSICQTFSPGSRRLILPWKWTATDLATLLSGEIYHRPCS